MALVAGCAHADPVSPHIELLPMYGTDEGVQKTEAMRAADEQFIATILGKGYTRETGARKSIELGWSYFLKGDRDTAMKRFNQAWLLNPQNGDAIHGMAVVCAERHCKPEKVESLFKRAIAQPEVRVAAFVDYGRFLWMSGRRDDALALLRRSLEIDPKARDARRHMALIDFELSKTIEACQLAKDAQANGDDMPPNVIAQLCR